MGLTIIVPFIWGLCESTFFFIVPDFWLSGLAFMGKTPRQLAVAVFSAACGAILGGMTLYWLSRGLADTVVYQFLLQIPGISVMLIKNVAATVNHYGIWSYWKGMWSGQPFKIYASEWGGRMGPVWPWIFISFLARCFRFILSTVLASIIARTAERNLKNWINIRAYVFAAFWGLFYIFYFTYFHLKYELFWKI